MMAVEPHTYNAVSFSMAALVFVAVGFGFKLATRIGTVEAQLVGLDKLIQKMDQVLEMLLNDRFHRYGRDDKG